MNRVKTLPSVIGAAVGLMVFGAGSAPASAGPSVMFVNVKGARYACNLEWGADYPGNDLGAPQKGGGAGDPFECCLRAIENGVELFQTTKYDECFLKSKASGRVTGLHADYVAGRVSLAGAVEQPAAAPNPPETERKSVVYPDGRRYEGEFRDGVKNGRGVFTWADGQRYEGEFRDDTMHGRGTYSWGDGRRYEGPFLGGIKSGKGVFIWPNGDRYEGEYRDDKRNGRGILYHANGQREEGEWRDGTLVAALPQPPPPTAEPRVVTTPPPRGGYDAINSP